MKRSRQLLCASILCAFGGSAMAFSSATASISGIQFTLYDLNLNDGIAPSLMLANGVNYYNYSQGSVWDYTNYDPSTGQGGLSDSNQSQGLNGEATQVTVAAGGGTASTASSILTQAGGNVVSGGVSAEGAANGLSSYSATSYQGNGYQLTLSPYTLLSITAVGAVDAQTTQGYDPAYTGNSLGYLPYNMEYAYANASMSVSGSTNTNSQSGTESMVASVSYKVTYDPVTGESHYSGDAQSSTTPLALAFTNGSAQERQLYFYSYAGVNGYSIAAVPEPETYALMLTGIGLVGAMARRRRGRSA